MRVRHEDLLYWSIMGAVTLVLMLFAVAIFTTNSWEIGGQLAVFSVPLVLWLCAVIGVTAAYWHERDEKKTKEDELKERQDKLAIESAEAKERMRLAAEREKVGA